MTSRSRPTTGPGANGTEARRGPAGRPRPGCSSRWGSSVVRATRSSWLCQESQPRPRRRRLIRGLPGKRPERGRRSGADLDVRLEALEASRGRPRTADRNPFRFYMPPPPPPPPPEPASRSRQPGRRWSRRRPPAAAAAADPAEVHRDRRRRAGREGRRVQRLPHDDARARRGNHRRAVPARAHRRRVGRDGVRGRPRTDDDPHVRARNASVSKPGRVGRSDGVPVLKHRLVARNRSRAAGVGLRRRARAFRKGQEAARAGRLGRGRDRVHQGGPGEPGQGGVQDLARTRHAERGRASTSAARGISRRRISSTRR